MNDSDVERHFKGGNNILLVLLTAFIVSRLNNDLNQGHMIWEVIAILLRST